MNRPLRIGLDVDGVFADFSSAYMRLIIRLTGRDLFLENDWGHPPCWDWDLMRGYSEDERTLAFDTIATTPDWWFHLLPVGPLPCMETPAARMSHAGDVFDAHEVYFISNRVGLHARSQTAQWIKLYMGIPEPTVLIVGHRVKGSTAKALNLDVYLDDNYDNCTDCLRESPTTRTYLFNRSYNVGPEINRVEQVEQRRVHSIQEFLDCEGLL